MATLEEKVDTLMVDMKEIKTALKYNGTGLIPSFEKHCESDRCFREDYYKFKRWAIGVFCFMVGSGVIGLSAVKIAQIVGG